MQDGVKNPTIVKDRKIDKLDLKKPKKINVAASRLKRRLLKHVWLSRGLLAIALVLGFYALYLGGLAILKKTGADYYLNLARYFIFTPEEKIKSFDDATNILILGKGGMGHEAPDITDTIIFTSISHKDSGVKLISLPRDIWIEDLRTKLNSIYYWGNVKEEGGGIILAKSTVEEIVGKPVHYALVVDFSGFRAIIDTLGGVEVDVERSFVDEKYPIAGKEDDDCGGDPEYKCRYETLRFAQGKQIMDGETALQFVRSRNAEGDEGTDFARAARQQRVMTAVKDKLMSVDVLFSPSKLKKLRSDLSESLETDIDSAAAAILARRLIQSRNKISSNVLPEDLLIRPPYQSQYDNLYVFIPRGGDWGEIHKWAQCIIQVDNCL